ncbi:hypothetical protein B0H11DRAFT_2332791 [Mycena galericulata]|nr:hypothetical protein B0H11DRAFT_2332791 [Mycena galericulata]
MQSPPQPYTVALPQSQPQQARRARGSEHPPSHAVAQPRLLAPFRDPLHVEWNGADVNVGAMLQAPFTKGNAAYGEVEESRWQATRVSTISIMNFSGRILVVHLISDNIRNVFGSPRSYSLVLVPTLFFLSISAAMTGIDRTAISQRISCVQYMSPWIKNMALFVNPTSPLYERSGARVRDAIRVLCDMSASPRFVWSEIARLDPLIVDVVPDELIRAATDGGFGSSRCEYHWSLNKQTGGKPPRTLYEYPNWAEISTLVRLCHVASYQAQRPAHNLLYVPKILHLVTLTAGVGPSLVRKSVYGIVINLLQAMNIGRTEDAPASDLLQLLADCETAESQKLFGLERVTQSSEYVNFDVMGDIPKVDTQEKLTELLARFLEVTAGSRGLLNVWRARWMGLAMSTAFQYSPAIQMRLFTTLGTLLTQEADDDYLYQMLVALRTALQQASEQDSAIVVTMLRSLAKVVPALPDTSRYFAALFWLAVALLESSHVVFYIEAGTLLPVTPESMRARGMFRNGSVSTVLLEGCDTFESVLGQFDSILSISFDTNFSFALASVLFKGMRASIVRTEAEKVPRTLLGVTMRPYVREEGDINGVRDALAPEALGYFIALLPVSTTHAVYRRLLKECNLGEAALPETSGIDDATDAPKVQVSLLGIDGAPTVLLAASFIGAVVTSAQGNDAEMEMLYLPAVGHWDVVRRSTRQDQGHFLQGVEPDHQRGVEHLPARAGIQPAAGGGGGFTATLPRGGGSTSTLSTVEEAAMFTPGRSHLEALEEINMAGIASNFVFLPLTGGAAIKVIQWIPELVNLIVQQS